MIFLSSLNTAEWGVGTEEASSLVSEVLEVRRMKDERGGSWK